mmetsp:Transcript_26481/g.79013  ORF Transcript_26481/g.79013 Transcript_26481/m.79013 type:complete len:209 (-) Transcript_26481:434-1060(-)
MLPGRLVQHKGLLQPGQRLPRRGALAARQARPHRLCAGGVALRARRGRGAAHVQRRGLQRDEGRLLVARLAALPRRAAGDLPRQHVRQGLRRRPRRDCRADLRPVQALPRRVLPPLQLAHLLLRRRPARGAARPARLVPRSLHRAGHARSVADRDAGEVRHAAPRGRAFPRVGRRGGAGGAVAHGHAKLAAQREAPVAGRRARADGAR